MTDAQAAIWREAVRLNKEGSERERLLAYADLCEMKGDQALEEALDNAVRIHDPTECFLNVGHWFAAAAALRARTGEVPMTHSLDGALVEKVARVLCNANFFQQGAEGEFGTWWSWRNECRAALEAAGVAELREENAALKHDLERWIAAPPSTHDRMRRKGNDAHHGKD